MKFYYFTEMPYPFIPDDYAEKYGSARVTLPNNLLDPQKAYDLYHEYLDEFEYADELGLNIMLNEHHQTTTCLDVALNMTGAALARRTKQAKILLMGNQLPLRDNPLRVAEEVAYLDYLSGGRVISGFVRGVGSDIHPANSHPYYNYERFYEAHDLIVKAWTTGEPFHWEGKHFHYRYANPWPRPYQQPHPPIWVTGATNQNHIAWAADHQYTYATFLTANDDTAVIYNLYRQFAEEKGVPSPGPDKFAHMCIVYVGETDEEAEKEGQKLLWYLEDQVPAGFWSIPGYGPPSAFVKFGLKGRNRKGKWEEVCEKGIVIAGSPDTVAQKIKKLYAQTGLGHLAMMMRVGFITHESAQKSIELFAKEVVPQVKELGEIRVSISK